MIRKATARDVAAVAAIYDAILTKEEQGPVTVGWLRGVYPTEQTARLQTSEEEFIFFAHFYILDISILIVIHIIINIPYLTL